MLKAEMRKEILRSTVIMFLAACALSGAGCLKVMYYVQFEDDGRGRVTEVIKVERKVLMLQHSLDLEESAEDILTEANARERAKLMNAKLGFFEVKTTDDGGLQATAVYTFKHIQDLKLCMYPWPTQASNDYWQKAHIVFTYSMDEVRQRRHLWINAIVPGRDKGTPTSEAQARTPAELQQVRRLLPIFRDMLSGFQLFFRIQYVDKEHAYHKERRDIGWGDWDGQYTPLSITGKDLIFDEDVLMFVIPWEIVGREKELVRRMEDVRYRIGGQYHVGTLEARILRVDGEWRFANVYYQQDFAHVSRLLPDAIKEAPQIELPPPIPPKRPPPIYLANDMRLLQLQNKADVPEDFIQPDFDDSGWRRMNVVCGEAILPEPILLYRKRFAVPANWNRDICQLRFEGVRDRCVIYLNGKEVGKHDGWDKRFYLDVAQYVNYGGENLLAVYVENLTDVGGIWKEIDIGDLRFTSEFHLTRAETLAEESEAQKALRKELPKLPGIIVFQMHSAGEPENKENWDIYCLKPDGTNLKCIVDDAAADVHPRISPDGRQVLFLSLREHWDEILAMRKLPPNHWEKYGVYYLIDIEGNTPPKRLWPATDLGSDACWSPDGKAIAFAQHDPPRINIKRLDTGEVITHTPPDVFECASPTFSPDGKQLIFIDLENVEERGRNPEDRWGKARVAYLDPGTYELVGKKWALLTETLKPDQSRYGGRGGPNVTRSVALSPNGKYIAFSTTDYFWRWHRSYLYDSMNPQSLWGETDLGFVETKMYNTWRHRPERRMYNECPIWSPDSRYILFVRGPDHEEAKHFHFVRQFRLVDWMDLYLADPRGERCVRLTWLKQRMGHPDCWAPRH